MLNRCSENYIETTSKEHVEIPSGKRRQKNFHFQPVCQRCSNATGHIGLTLNQRQNACRDPYMYVCMHASMYVCMHICMHVWMDVCMHVCMYACMYACMYVGMHACTHGCMHACMYVCMHACVCVSYSTYCIFYVFRQHCFLRHDDGVCLWNSLK